MNPIIILKLFPYNWILYESKTFLVAKSLKRNVVLFLCSAQAITIKLSEGVQVKGTDINVQIPWIIGHAVP